MKRKIIYAFLIVSWFSSMVAVNVQFKKPYVDQLRSAEATVSQLAKDNTMLRRELEELYRPETIQGADIPTWSIALPVDLQEYTYSVCVTYGDDNLYRLALAVMWQESKYTSGTISSTNDYGIMQINKSNHKWLSTKLGLTDFLDDKQSIQAGVFMLANLVEKYSDYRQVLMAYNYGEAGAKRRWSQGTYTSAYADSVLSYMTKELI